MGGATVLMASGLRLPQNVRGVLADCPFTSPAEMIMEFGRTRKLPMKIAYPMTGIAAKLFGDFSLKDADAVEAVKNTEVPILIIHGEADGLPPPPPVDPEGHRVIEVVVSAGDAVEHLPYVFFSGHTVQGTGS